MVLYSGLFDLKSLPNSNSLNFQKETWTGGILAEWLSGGLRWAGSRLSCVSIAGIGRGGIGAVAKPELHAIGRRWVALWPFPPLCPSTSSCNTRNQFPKLFKILPNSCSKPKIYWVWFVGWVGWFNEIISPDPSIASLLIDCFLPVLLKLPVTCVTNPHIDHNPPHNPLHHAIFITSQTLTEIFLYSWFWLFHISPCVEKYWRLHFNHETATTLSYFCFNSVLTLNSNRYIHLY